MKVKQIMAGNVVSVGPRESVTHAARLMKRNNLGALPVCAEDGRLRGIVTDRDIVVRCVAGDDDPDETQIREIMSRGVATCSADDEAEEALRSMTMGRVRRLPVTDGGRLVGMVSLADLARSEYYTMEAAEALSEISGNILRK